MRKDYCDKCGKEINLQHHEGNILLPYINDGNFQYNLEYSFNGNLSLYRVKGEGEFDKTLNLCISCAPKLIKSIEKNIHYLSEDN